MGIALVILAAGKGTRMNSDKPKVLHEIAGAPMLIHAMRSAAALEPERTVIVTGFGHEAVSRAVADYDDTAEVVYQADQNGTGHAVQVTREVLGGFDGDIVVLFGDTPFVRGETLLRMQDARATNDLVVLGFDARDPGKYGRLKMDKDRLTAIVEHADASPEERAITFCNSGVMMASASLMFDLLGDTNNDNAQGEIYLTDIVGIANSRDLAVTAVTCDEAETLGINSRLHLADAERIFQERARAELLEDGVTFQRPETVTLAYDTVIGRDTVVEPYVFFGPGVTIESGAHIRAFSHLEGAHVSRGGVVGPYARLRPGTELAEDVKVGNFVEIKNAQIDEGAKVNHLSYIGDAVLGAATNVGAGTITCNYDGVMKHRTTVGRNVFIGSNTMLVAPVTIGNEAMTASGSVITKDVEDGALGISRAQQVNKPGFARKLFEMLKAKKANKTNEAE